VPEVVADGLLVQAEVVTLWEVEGKGGMSTVFNGRK
jgi:hypothetical protein